MAAPTPNARPPDLKVGVAFESVQVVCLLKPPQLATPWLYVVGSRSSAVVGVAVKVARGH